MGAAKFRQAHCKDMSNATNDSTIPDRSRPGLPTTALSIENPQDGSAKCATRGKPTIRLPAKTITVGTWNVRTLHACGKVRELEHAMSNYNWDILGLCEMRWTGFGETTTEEGHKIWYSGDQSQHRHGVAFMVRRGIAGCVISCTPVSSRVIMIRVSGRPVNITVIQVYAPTTDYEDQEVEEFYEEIETTIKKVPKKDFLIVQGDWNAKVGPDAYEQWAGTAGRFAVGETNDRGLRLLEFASEYKLTLANTLFPHKLSRRTTWHAPNGLVHNQIDFILTPRRFKSSINKARTRTYPGADVGSDHDLVMMVVKLKLRRQKQPENTRIKFDLDKLRDPQVAAVFQAQLGGKFAALNLLDGSIDDLEGNFRKTVLDTAEEVLGRQRKKKQPWVTNEVLDLCDKRRKLKGTRHTTPEAAEQYREANKTVHKRMLEAKEDWISKQCETIEQGMERGICKKAYETLKLLTKAKQNKSTVIEDSKGKLLTDDAAVLQRWTEYCQELYNFQLHPDTSLLNPGLADRTPDPLPVLREEVEHAVRTLKEGKSPGPDNIPGELLKHGGDAMTNALTVICQRIWEAKEWPKDWTQSLIIPLPKKGNTRQCQNHRTISLISHPSKVMLRVLLNRLKTQAEEILAEEQAGFRAGRSTVEQIFNCRILIEKHLQHQKDLYHNFIDFKKAFDRVWHEGLWHVLRGFNIEEGLVQTIQALYGNATSAVLFNNKIGEAFRTTVGVRQGCLLSPALFNIFLEIIMQETLADFQTTISIGGRPICNLRFADDIDLLGGSNAELQELTDSLSERAGAYGMEISAEKSKTMVNSHDDLHADITMNGQKLEEVEAFKYLGATITKDGRSTTEIKIRMATATAAMAKLSTIWRSRTISFPTKLKLYKSLVLSILLYGCESWTLTAELEERIRSFEMKCFRRLLQISWREHRTNDSVRLQVSSLAGPQEPLLSTIKRRKLSWFGHVTRHNTLSKTILQGTVEGGRRKGRQRKSWVEDIKSWTMLEMPELLTVTQDRTNWRRLSSVAALMSPPRPGRVKGMR